MFTSKIEYTFIGDVHGKIDEYLALRSEFRRTIQVGDMGVGFGSPYPPEGLREDSSHRWIRGNHDNPDVAELSPTYIDDGTVLGDMMFIGGAFSMDRLARVSGVDWWPDEELDQASLDYLVEVYEEVRPRVMVTHDCPDSVARYLFPQHYKHDEKNRSRTRAAFERMLTRHSPEHWIFGHWHENRKERLGHTTFVCLGELQTITLLV